MIEALDEMTALVAAECAIETRMLTQQKDEFVHGAHADAGGPSVALAVEELYDLMDTQKDAHLSRELTLQHQAETVTQTPPLDYLRHLRVLTPRREPTVSFLHTYTHTNTQTCPCRRIA